jgi:thiamine pyrophosphokinase
MNALIISNGEISNYNYYKNIILDSNIIICADGGAKHAYKMNIIPNLIVGDFDSLDEDILNFYKEKGVKIEKYSPIKDKTDTQIATLKAIEMGTDNITYIGTLGNRFDHLIANLSLLYYLLNRKIKGRIINEKNEIYLINEYIELTGQKGDIVSLLPYSKDVHGIYTEGLYYPLSGQDMPLGIPYGISNIFTENKITIKIEDGFLLVIKSRD